VPSAAGSRWRRCPATRPSSIRWSTSGATGSTTNSRTCVRNRSANSATMPAQHSVACAVARRSSPPFGSRRNCSCSHNIMRSSIKEGGTQALPRRRRSPQTPRAPGYRSRATQPARSISSRRRCYLCGLPWGASPSAVATISERRAGKGLRLAEEREHRFQRTVTLAVKFALSKFDLGTFVRCEISE